MAFHLHCHGCGARYERKKLRSDEWARCSRCGTVLETYSVLRPDSWLALCLSALIGLIFANAFPLAILDFQGLEQSAGFLDAIRITWSAGYEPVAVMTFAVGFFFPLLHLLILLWIFIPLAVMKIPGHIELALLAVDHLRRWCMVPVLLTGILVSAFKMADFASLSLQPGLYSLIFSTLLLTAIGTLDSHKISLMILDLGLPLGEQKAVKPPSPAMVSRTWALLCAAAVMYVPANLLPIMSTSGVTGDSSHTIMGGIIELCEMGSWDVAAVVFIASMVVPIFKLVALALLVWQTQQGHVNQLEQRTRLYVFVEIIGQWSMLDVFVVLLMSALVQFGSLMSIQPSAGAAAFGAVVVLTMLAAMGFDPRLAWRRAGHKGFLKQ